MKALYAAASGMAAQQTRLDNIANNLANVNTVGFKKAREDFQDLFYQQLVTSSPGVTASRAEVGSGVRLVAIEKNHSAGALTETGGELDVAIEGSGMFQFETADGERVYSRDGSFRRDASGQIVSSGGLRVGDGITIPEDAQRVTVTDDGTVKALLAGDIDYTTIGQLDVFRFVNPGGLMPIGGNLYVETPESGMPTAIQAGSDVKLHQGFLEGSNVDIAEELIQMIMAQRSYELNSKVVKAAEDALGVAVNLKR